MPSDPTIGETLATAVVINFVGVIAGFGTATVSVGLIVAIVGFVVGVAGSSVEIGVIFALAGVIEASGLETTSSTVGFTTATVAMLAV